MKRLLVLIIILLVFNVAGYNAVFNAVNNNHQQIIDKLDLLIKDK